jgi:hypothetical protein
METFAPCFSQSLLLSDFTASNLYSEKIHTKIRDRKKLKSIPEWKNEGRKPDRNSSLRRLEFMPVNLI